MTLRMPRALVALVCTGTLAAAQAPASNPIGRWDLSLQGAQGTVPSWLEITKSGTRTLVGRFVGSGGSARPISRVDVKGDTIRFGIPPQWDAANADLRFEGTLAGDRLAGTITNPNGDKVAFTGERAPRLERATPAWGTAIELFNGKDLSGWSPDNPARTSGWRAENGVLRNATSGANLVTTQKFTDFKLHIEFRYPRNGNSGVYLRGRYEVQVEDTPAREWPESIDLGGVYGFLTPNASAGTGVGTWQTFDVTLVGRRVTVVLNGKTIINDQIIPGITGGALDSAEGLPGPIMLQGDHTAVEYRNIKLTPAK